VEVKRSLEVRRGNCAPSFVLQIQPKVVWRARRSDWIAERGRALALLLRHPGDAERVRRGLGATAAR